jgi:hypothetical protein
VEIVDRDEFEQHQITCGYPPEVIAAAERAADDAFATVSGGGPPWDGDAARAWRRVASS